ncbi:restriction endonuclease subunit S [Bradymonadaceae bacterium TMQ3]|nr:restriction endonuclease subunit S [Bradymonadaceae bacterium TMQ3]TXC76494.1 restriction endonuclease subunit S [Bradymonadales bacterium TMQ1]
MRSEILFKNLLSATLDGDWGESEPTPGHLPYRVIRGTDFPNAKLGITTDIPLRYIKKSTAKRRTLQPGDIIIETAGGSKNRPTGRTLFITKDLLDSFDAPATCASFCRFLRVKPAQADPAYIYWHLQNMYIRGLMWQHQVQHTGIARFQYTRFSESVTVKLPPLNKQRSISLQLNTLNAKITLNSKINRTLEAMARALFKSWFIAFDPVRAKMEGRQPAGLDPETAALFPERLVDSELGLIPEGWEVKSLGEIMKKVSDGVDPDDLSPSTPYIGLGDMPERSIALDTWGQAGDVNSRKSKFKKGQILFGRLRPYFHKVGIAPVDGISSTDIQIIIPKKFEWYGYLVCMLSDPTFIDYCTSVSSGTRMPRVKWSDMQKYKIAIAPDKLADQFTKWTQPVFKQIITNIFQNKTLEKQRDALLPALLSGVQVVES